MSRLEVAGHDPHDLSHLPRMTGRYRFPKDTWDAKQDECRNAIAARLRDAVREQGGTPRGGISLDATSVDGDEMVLEASIAAEVTP